MRIRITFPAALAVALLFLLPAPGRGDDSKPPREGVGDKVAILIDGIVAGDLEPLISRYVEDVGARFGARFLVRAGRWSTPAEVRGLLRTLHEEERITGAILVGDIPYARHKPITPSKYR